MKKIKLNENQYYRLFEGDISDTPQNFLKSLASQGKVGSLRTSSLSTEDVIEIINHELGSNTEMESFNGKDNINYFGFLDNFQNQKYKDKIYIERAIAINHVSDILSYEGVGTSWSWSKGSSESYFGYGDIHIVLKGYVSLDDVDWVKTTFLNAYPLNEQKEIRIKVNKPIEILGFNFNDKHYKLNQSLIINSGLTDIGI